MTPRNDNVVPLRTTPGSFRLPSVEQIADLPPNEKASVRGHLLALLAASFAEPASPCDRVLTLAEAAHALGRSPDWLRRNGADWHARLVAEFGIGFVMQPVENGDVRYSADGIELLKRYWRGGRGG